MPSTDAVRERLEWALEDGLVILGIALAWAALALVVNVVLALLRFLLFETGLFRALPELVGEGLYGLLRAGPATGLLVQLALANVLLYVLARAGMLVVGAYRGTGEAT